MADEKKEFTCSWNQALHILGLSDLCLTSQRLSCLRLSALALWNFASGEPAKGRIPQGESAVNDP